MKIILASFFEPEYHGSGRKIGVAPSKPKNLDYDCDFVFEPFSPGELYWEYHKLKNSDYDKAITLFKEGYKQQLDNFMNELYKMAENDKCDPIKLLPFENGDTLLSWEKRGNVSYRGFLANYLRELDYDVEEN